LRHNLEIIPNNKNIEDGINIPKTNTTLAQLKNRDTYRQTIQDKVNLSIIFKEHEDIELETNNIINLLQHAAKGATPKSNP
jgi:hypothetical protein